MIEVTNIAALKAQSATVGTLVEVHGYFNAGDGGGGIFIAIPLEDFVSDAAVAASGAKAARTFSAINWKYGVERQQPLLGHYADQIKWNGGAVWTNDQVWLGPNATDSAARTFFGDASVGVANGEKGYLIPKVEGFRVIPTYVGWDKSFIWERVVETGEMTPEMFGGIAGRSVGNNTGGVDCTTAIQALLDSPFTPKFSGASYYISNRLVLKQKKTIYGVGCDNATPMWEYTRSPIIETGKDRTCIWTNQNIDMLSIQQNCHIRDIHFDVSYTANGVYDKDLVSYDLSFPHTGSSIENCSFKGNPITTRAHAGKGGTGIRFNMEDADNTFSRRDDTLNVYGCMQFFSSKKLWFMHLAIGSKCDESISGTTSGQTGETINHYTNCNYLDASYDFCKIGADWRNGSMHKITGEYFQDNFVLPYEERDFPCFRLLCGVTVDVGIGDQRSTLPTVNDSVALGGTVTYPQNHFSGYAYETNGGVAYTGRSLRNYNWQQTALLGTPAYAMDNEPYINLDGQTGHLSWDRTANSGKYTVATSWVDNAFLFADKKATVTINALRSTDGFDFKAATNELVNVLPKATGITLSQMDGLWDIKDVKTPTIIFGAGSNAALDFVEICIKNAIANQNIVNRLAEIIIALKVGCNAIQVISRRSNGTIDTNRTSVTTDVSDLEKSLRFVISSQFSTNKTIIRFIGSTGVNTVIRALHGTTNYFVDYPFLPTHGGTLQGPITFASNLGLAPLTKRATVSISSAELLVGFSDGVKPVIRNSWVNIKSVEVRTTGGTLNYATNTMLDFFQGTSLCPLFTIDLAKLVRNGNRRMIQLNPDNEQFAASGLSYRVRNGNPTGGNKAIQVVIDYTDV